MDVKADAAIASLSQFSYTSFEELFLMKKNTLLVLDAMANYETEVRNEGRISTANPIKMQLIHSGAF